MAGLRRGTGDEIGGYEVIDTLGRGGSGAVYRVRDGGGTVAALKLVDARDDEVAARRLEREVNALQSLRHPAVPQVLDAELDGDEKFVVFEYIAGVSLWNYVQEYGPLEGDELANFAERTASALEAVHAAGVVHRDVTPSNIMIGPEGASLIDFGLSHKEHDARLTRDGLVSGTAGYVAPEVIDGAEPGPVADWWAWAATLAYTMTGTAPFGSGTGAISRTLEAQVELPDVPGADAVRAALGRDISARPGPREVVAALRGDTTVIAGVSERPHGRDVPLTQATPTLAPTQVMATEVTHTVADAVTSDGQRASDGPEGAIPGQPDYVVDDELERASSELPLARAPRRPIMTVTWMIAIASAAALAPFVAAATLIVVAVVVRAVQRRALALHASRQRKGARRGDVALHTLGFPWHLLRSLGETILAALIALAAGGGVAALGWWLVETGRLDIVPEAREWVLPGALAGGALVVAGALWWGVWMEMTREGGRRVASALAPSRPVAAAWVTVALAAIGVVVLAVYLGAEPWWWPASELLQ